MILAEKHMIRRGNPMFKEIDKAAYMSKNLYNATLYAIRQHFFEHKEYLPYARLNHIFSTERNIDYISLPAKVAQQTMKMVDQNFKAFFKGLQSFKKNPKKFKARPRIPKYLDKEGRQCLTYTVQSISKRSLEQYGVVVPSGLDVSIRTKVKYNELKQVKVSRASDGYVVNILYEVADTMLLPDNGRYAAIDIGLDNLACVTSNVEDVHPFAISGKRIKSVNHHYNKCLAKAKTLLEKRNGRNSSNRICRMGQKRKDRIDDYFHKSSRYIVNQLVSNNINTLIVGKNDGWKQDINIGSVNNQNFVQVPFYRFINMLRYKCALKGIAFLTQEESYTSKCSFLDREEICKHDDYLGRRVKRGLFRAASGRKVNADVNGSYNILRKCKPNAFDEQWYNGCVVHPVVIRTMN